MFRAAVIATRGAPAPRHAPRVRQRGRHRAAGSTARRPSRRRARRGAPSLRRLGAVVESHIAILGELACQAHVHPPAGVVANRRATAGRPQKQLKRGLAVLVQRAEGWCGRAGAREQVEEVRVRTRSARVATSLPSAPARAVATPTLVNREGHRDVRFRLRSCGHLQRQRAASRSRSSSWGPRLVGDDAAPPPWGFDHRQNVASRILEPRDVRTVAARDALRVGRDA